MNRMEIVALENLVVKTHVYRKMKELFPEKEVAQTLGHLALEKGADGFGLGRLFKCLFLQFMEDLSDREMERFLQENTAAKWFCGFGISEKTPSFTLFGKVRQRIGTSLLSELFGKVRDSFKAKGYISEVFTFVDASHLIAKASLWEERDKAMGKKIQTFNNLCLAKVAADTQAKIGCKGKSKFWYGFKKHVSVDMKMGLINKVAITPANVTDGQGLIHVCPRSGAVYADKGYCGQKPHKAALQKGAELRAILKNNMKAKNKDLDRYISRIRAPFEGTFAQDNKRARYKGIVKNQFAALMQAMAFNLKRLCKISELLPA